jgi:hypothetical protein
MGTRGPKSHAELTTVQSNVVPIERKRPPQDLAADAASEWTRIVNAQPADWLTPGLDVILAGYCRWTVVERREASLIERLVTDEEFDEDAYSRAMNRMEKASRYLASAAVRLGFAHSTAYDKRKPKGVKKSLREDW